MKKSFLLLVVMSFFSLNTQSNTWSTKLGDSTQSSTWDTTFKCTGSECIHCGECENVFLVSEKTALNRLYWNDENNPFYFKLDNFPLDYYIAILTDHIKKLENKIAKDSRWWQSSGIYKALGMA